MHTVEPTTHWPQWPAEHVHALFAESRRPVQMSWVVVVVVENGVVVGVVVTVVVDTATVVVVVVSSAAHTRPNTEEPTSVLKSRNAAHDG